MDWANTASGHSSQGSLGKSEFYIALQVSALKRCDCLELSIWPSLERSRTKEVKRPEFAWSLGLGWQNILPFWSSRSQKLERSVCWYGTGYEQLRLARRNLFRHTSGEWIVHLYQWYAFLYYLYLLPHADFALSYFLKHVRKNILNC